MKPLKHHIYMTSAEIEELLRTRQSEADLLPPGQAKQSILIEIAKMQSYRDLKQWAESPLAISSKKRGATR